VIEGRREQLEGKLQQRYGFAKDQIHKDVDDWFRTRVEAHTSCGSGDAPLNTRSEPSSG
jgi:hypothetical protein